jgi:WD40 repeat protein
VDRVAYPVEQALQSNEIINVFQDDFDMLGDSEAAMGGKVNTSTMIPRHYLDSDYCKNKRVTCIKFHPTRPYLVAMSMIDNMDFDTRAIIQGKSFDSQLLVLDFQDNDIISLAYLLETPIEVTTIEWHAANPNALFGGCLNGQVIVWDLTAKEKQINSSNKKSGGGGEDGGNEVSEEKAQFVHMKHLKESLLQQAHKAFVADLAFVPPTINVDKRAPSEGKHTHMISVSEDGIVNIWDTRNVDKETLKAAPDT